MRCSWIAIAVFSLVAIGCSDSPAGESPEADLVAEPEVTDLADFTDWPLGNTGTIPKPKYGQGCRYKAVDGELWEQAADGDNDRLTLVGPASGEVNLTLYAMAGTASVMLATVDFHQRHLVGKAYYEAAGSLQFGAALAEMWTVVDGTLCFASSVVSATGDVAGEFSLIAEEDAGNGLRTVGGTFTVSASAINGSDPLNINDESIALDIP